MIETTPLEFQVLLAQPRAFCAGVERAIQTVEMALERRAPNDKRPVYVRHEIVHNKTVVDGLRARGAVFVQATREIPEGATTVFSAHGVAPDVQSQAAQRALETIDATCPLVARVHASVRRHVARGHTILYIGGAGHAEVEGVISEAPDRVILIQSVADAASVEIRDPNRVAYCTETTFAIDTVAAIVKVLRARFPAIIGPEAGDVCYAVQNRQEAVLGLVERHHAQLVLVMGSSNSANSRRLGEVALRAGARYPPPSVWRTEETVAHSTSGRRRCRAGGILRPRRPPRPFLGMLRPTASKSARTRAKSACWTSPARIWRPIAAKFQWASAYAAADTAAATSRGVSRWRIRVKNSQALGEVSAVGHSLTSCPVSTEVAVASINFTAARPSLTSGVGARSSRMARANASACRS
jgi:(E)-4-hydroxy-3-methyl-but-2-enyl pyrophosphate reductase